jgi:hypothetical protein
MFNFYLVHIKKLTYKSEDLLQNVFDVNMRGAKNKRAIEIALASRLCDHSKLKM